MAELLPAIGTASYGAITFGVKTETVEFSGTPKYDASGRTIVYTVWRIRLRTLIYNDSGTTDTQIDAMRVALLTPGDVFTYATKGVGSFTINAGGVFDTVWGPKPTLFTWKPSGSNRAVKVEWGVEVAIPQCGPSGSAHYQFQLMETGFKLAITKNLSGRSTRTTTGYLVIPQTRAAVGNRTLQDSADAYLDLVIPSPIAGFRRKSPDIVLDESKCRLDFTVVDEELPSPLQPGVIECRASQRFRTTGNNLGIWMSTISAQYTMSADLPRARAWDLFIALVQERVNIAQLNGQHPNGGNSPVIFQSLDIGEPDIFGENQAEFSVSYTVPTTLNSFLAASGLWRPVASANDALWAASLAQTAFHNRGTAKLQFNPNSDAILDLCSNPSVTLSNVDGTAMRAGLPGVLATLSTAPLTPANSWVKYQCVLRTGSEDRIMEHKPLGVVVEPQSPITLTALQNPTGGPGALAGATLTNGQFPAGPYAAGNPCGIYQAQGVPSIEMFVEGAALRAGYLIQQPQLLSVNGVPVLPANRPGREYFESWLAGNYNYPMVAAVWRLRYMVTAIPSGGLGIPSTPIP